MATTVGSVSDAYSSSQIKSLVTLAIYNETSKLTSLQSTQSRLTTTQTAITSLQSTMSALSTAVNNIMTAGALDTKKAQSSDASVASASVSAAATAGSYALNVTSLAAGHKLGSSALVDSGTSVITAAGEGTKIFRIASGTTTEDISVNLAAGDTNNAVLAKIMDAVNSGSSAGRASLIKETSGATTLVIEAKDTGLAGKLTLSDTTGTLLKSSGVLNSSGTAARELQAASDATFTIGSSLTVTRSSNTISDAITGVTVNLNKLGAASLTVTADSSAVTSSIASFISSYNSAQTELRTQLTELPDASNPNRGILFGNSQLRTLSNNLRMQLAGSRNLVYSSLSAIGIKPVDATTSATENVCNLTFDATAFQAALASNHAAVSELIAGTSGIFTQLKAGLDLTVKASGGTLANMASALTSRSDLIALRLKEAQDDITKKTAYYTSLYTTLAGQITNMQQQQSSFSTIYGNYYTASTTTTA